MLSSYSLREQCQRCATYLQRSEYVSAKCRFKKMGYKDEGTQMGNYCLSEVTLSELCYWAQYSTDLWDIFMHPK